jgi:hypothetical protein
MSDGALEQRARNHHHDGTCRQETKAKSKGKDKPTGCRCRDTACISPRTPTSELTYVTIQSTSHSPANSVLSQHRQPPIHPTFTNNLTITSSQSILIPDIDSVHRLISRYPSIDLAIFKHRYSDIRISSNTEISTGRKLNILQYPDSWNPHILISSDLQIVVSHHDLGRLSSKMTI